MQLKLKLLLLVPALIAVISIAVMATSNESVNDENQGKAADALEIRSTPFLTNDESNNIAVFK
jgi:hypothetical protein